MSQTLEQLRAGALAGVSRLTLRAGLTEFPREIFELADQLEILDLSGNALTKLPDDLPRLHRLRVLFCSDNPFTELPEVLGRCEQLEMVGFKSCRIETVAGAALPSRLRWLILTDNRIEQLPPEIGRCDRLQKLALAGNRLRALPSEMAACHNLELLRISANRLAELPGWLLALPRLSWLAGAGNPCCADAEQATLANSPIAAIAWQELQLQQILGQGASGVIHRAEHRQTDPARPVAVKLFKGEMTSDGRPESEMAACLASGAHDHLIPLLGRIEAHPQAVQGLVMALVGPEFRSLAAPPSLESCTRDIYPADSRWSLGQALQLASGLASALAHLHARGVLHGDFYGHNILHDGNGRALLGDFGAATLLAGVPQELASALQQLELRAFGCLLEELIERIDPAQGDDPRLAGLAALRDACLDPLPARRPGLPAIVAALARLRASGR
ncbi:leucine-rich repeat-containing protein kinase family protein [Malikia sp.]|uniref:leucine-rich repeat-containing protein kinase family protein n=1 Tax=Malikia sp. TaxID=2070706 RepID=UPI002635959E|nr:leucine-rich repeat-containing protein kinase family protein [Malikia sp.]MDD2729830.1 leucine-rich repeat-containing protein kinase family protein [Malikia sp.]